MAASKKKAKKPRGASPKVTKLCKVCRKQGHNARSHKRGAKKYKELRG